MEQRLVAIEERNARVAADKAWEVSRTRRATIAIITYITAFILMCIIDAPQPFLSALVPTFGYLLSTLSLPWIKQRWLAHRKAL